MATLLTAEQVANRLGVSLCTAQRMIARRELPVVEIGRLVRVPDVGLDEWIRRHTEMPSDMEWSARGGRRAV